MNSCDVEGGKKAGNTNRTQYNIYKNHHIRERERELKLSFYFNFTRIVVHREREREQMDRAL